MAKMLKAEREKQFLQAQQREETIARVLEFSKKRFKRFDEIINELHDGADMTAHFSDRRIWKVSECFKAMQSLKLSKERKVFRDALIFLDEKSRLVKQEDTIEAIFNMALHCAYWRNKLRNWKPVSKQPLTQMTELADFLFCKYPVPAFLYNCLYETNNPVFKEWLILIGRGGKIREMKNVPIPFTQKTGHYFLNVPLRCTVGEALRWAQVKALGGDDRLAERVAYSWIGTKSYGDEDFWQSFIMLLINGGMFDHEKLTGLIDYTREEKRLRAGYHLKGRTLASMLRQSDTWHSTFAKYNGLQRWKSCGIGAYRLERKEDVIAFEELTSAAELQQEGRVMKHCVASYAWYCSNNRSAIFSLRKTSGGELTEIMATIELSVVNKRIVQAKGKMNQAISEEARRLMETWAAQEGLAINPYL